MTQTQSRKKNLFQMNVDLMHGPIFRIWPPSRTLF